METFEGFLNAVGEKPPGFTLDRINNEGNYEPGNVRWATRKEQNRNTRANDMIEFDGRILPLRAWADELRVTQGTLWSRLYRDGMNVEQAFTCSPNRFPGRKLSDADIKEIRASSGPQKALALRFGINQSQVSKIKSGRRWTSVTA